MFTPQPGEGGFVKGDAVHLTEEGNRYYQSPDPRQNLSGIVTEAGHTCYVVRADGKGFRVYAQFLIRDDTPPTQQEIDDAITSITQTPRRGQ